ncbi:hypothetical protein [Streptomyces sp. x-19]|uniref:hypothetical protein n=1 Tax=Streptomyces sp. x-19 TaxID=2789280 RepID=UPI003980817E
MGSWSGKDSGKELKPQFFPDQLATWLGLTLASEGHVTRILFPRITPGTDPAPADTDRTVTSGDFFTATTEDRYPDVFGLLPTSATDDQPLLNLLGALPQHAVTLGHDVTANTSFLVQITTPTAS